MTMQRARRLASVAVVASLALGGLSACRTEPGVAAYLAAGNITTAQVKRVLDDTRDKLAAQKKAPDPAAQAGASAPATANVPISGPDVVNTLISHQVLMRLAQRANAQLPNPLPLAQYAQRLGLPADATYVKLYTEVQGLLFVLNQKVQGVAPTDADYREIYDHLVAQKAIEPGTDFAQFTAGIPANVKQSLGQSVAVRNMVREDVAQQHVKVNPRYEPAEIDVYTERTDSGQDLKLLVVPLSQADSAPVTNAA
jgi:hypothetical protein